MLIADEIKEKAHGRWYGIITSLGVSIPDDPNKHSACPICGPGNNSHRFRFDDKNGEGTWLCSQCGAGDGLELLKRTLSIPFPEILTQVAIQVGYCDVDHKEQPKKDPAIALRSLWKTCKQTDGGDPVSKYLRSRGLLFRSKALLYCSQCYESKTNTHYPAMIAPIQDVNGNYLSLHRTYLTKDGEKADIEIPRKIMPAKKKLVGVAIRLWLPEDGLIGVAEGIETAHACKQLYHIPVWSVLDAGKMETFIPPKEIKRIVIFSDNDSNYRGQKAAYTLANRLFLKDFIVDVRIPKEIGDYNDIVLKNKHRRDNEDRNINTETS